ncbi:sigma factor [Micromonospora sp. M12]
MVRELNPLLWHVARAQGLAAEEAADVVQTTWLELVRGLHTIRSPSALTAWLVTTTRRESWRVRGSPAADAA